MSTKVGVVSLGCDKNRVDTEVMLENLAEGGYEITADPSEADVIIVNTCAFLQSSRQESIDTVLEMAHLKQNGICVYIYAPYTEINKRVNNRGTRGIAAENNETLLDIYNYRTPFYRKYADITVECTGFSAEKNADRIAAALEQKGFE